MLTEQERERFMRQIVMPGIGEEGQEILKNAKVLVVGSGGLGSPALYYLTVAGVGEIGIVDTDVVSLSNLNRQILHTEADLQRPKVESAVEKLQKLDASIRFHPMQVYLDENNAQEIPVSYTHLDVYKRQPLTISISTCWIWIKAWPFIGTPWTSRWSGKITRRPFPWCFWGTASPAFPWSSPI